MTLPILTPPLRPWLIWLLVLVPVGALGACCNIIGMEGCLCTDGTCQTGWGAVCGDVPSCSSVCQSHRGSLGGTAETLVACPSDAGHVPVDGGLEGPYGFPIVGWWMSPQDPAVACGPTSAVLGDGGYAALGLRLFSNVSTAAACAAGKGEDAGLSTGLVLDIGLGTPQFVAANLGMDAGPITQGLSPGVYRLWNEGVSVQNLCKIPPGYDAVMTGFEIGPEYELPLFNGAGTVTIDQFNNGILSGSLDAMLFTSDGRGIDGGSLTGRFSVSLCP